MKSKIKGINRGAKATLTLTSTGVHLKAKGTLGLWKVDEEIQYKDITGIKYSKGKVMGTITIKYFSEELILSHVNLEDREFFTAEVKNRIQNPAINGGSSAMDKIQKAKTLLDAGVLTEDEFNQVKEKYLKEI